VRRQSHRRLKLVARGRVAADGYRTSPGGRRPRTSTRVAQLLARAAVPRAPGTAHRARLTASPVSAELAIRDSRRRSAQRSAIMMVVMFVGTTGRTGMIDASIT
jgi:hypothetical protein